METQTGVVLRISVRVRSNTRPSPTGNRPFSRVEGRPTADCASSGRGNAPLEEIPRARRCLRRRPPRSLSGIPSARPPARCTTACACRWGSDVSPCGSPDDCVWSAENPSSPLFVTLLARRQREPHCTAETELIRRAVLPRARSRACLPLQQRKFLSLVKSAEDTGAPPADRVALSARLQMGGAPKDSAAAA